MRKPDCPADSLIVPVCSECLKSSPMLCLLNSWMVGIQLRSLVFFSLNNCKTQ